MLPRGRSRGTFRGGSQGHGRGRGHYVHGRNVLNSCGVVGRGRSSTSSHNGVSMVDSNLQRSKRGGRIKGRGRGIKSVSDRVDKVNENNHDSDLNLPASSCGLLIEGKVSHKQHPNKKERRKSNEIETIQGSNEKSDSRGAAIVKDKEKLKGLKPELEKLKLDKSVHNISSPVFVGKGDIGLLEMDSLKTNILTNDESQKMLSYADVSPNTGAKDEQGLFLGGVSVDEGKQEDSLPYCTSQCTGLKVLSVTTSSAGHIFTASDRARIVSNIPGVVIVNTAGKGDSLVLGVDIDEDKLRKLKLGIGNEWKITLVDTKEKDPFSYFKGWKIIPKVDKGGMFQLIVNLRGVGQVKRRNQLLELVKGYKVSKVVHGEGETILLVGHVLEFVAYSDCIRKLFSMDRRHSWQPKPVESMEAFRPLELRERYLWVKVKCPEMINLSDAHKQYSVYHELSNLGKVIQLENQLFGALDNYLAVFEDVGDVNNLAEQFNFLEIWPDSLPEYYIPSYGVDEWGFYSVSGVFPGNIKPEERNSFAEDMKALGAVGFRSGEAENSFSLHFVNSHCIERISRCTQYSSFRLTILSSLVRKAGLDKKLRKLVPAILKYKEQISELKKDGEQGCQIDRQGKKEIGVVDAVTTSELEEKESIIADDNVHSTTGFKQLVKSPLSQAKVKTMNSKQENTKDLAGRSVKKSKAEVKQVSNKLKSDHVQLDEGTLLKITGDNSSSISINCRISILCKFFAKVGSVAVKENEKGEGVVFTFQSRKKVENVLKSLCGESTNSIDKLNQIESKVVIDGSKLFKNKFGLVLNISTSVDPEKLKAHFLRFGAMEIETRSHVLVVWFDTKLSLFKAMTDKKNQKYKMVPSVHNFEHIDCPRSGDKNEKSECKDLKLTEREIFGFLWQKQKNKPRIRDDQIISRLLTNFVKKVSCKEVTVEEDGLSVSFSSKAQYSAALNQFCPSSVPDQEQLASLARKFTLLPARGNYGLFSTKRIKPEHVHMFTSSVVRNCGIWFTDKLAMFKVLRDPMIMKLYPALFIDCRNIFILSSKNMVVAKTPLHNEVSRDESLQKTVNTITNSNPDNLDTNTPSQQFPLKKKISSGKESLPIKLASCESSKTSSGGHGVMTRAASAKYIPLGSASIKIDGPDINANTSSSDTVMPDVYATDDVLKQQVSSIESVDDCELPVLSKDVEPVVSSPELGILKDEVSVDKAIITAAKPGLKDHITPPPLLGTLLKTGQGRVCGKFGHIPTARMVRSGYKRCRVPVITRSKILEEDLFLENKDCYRRKNVKEAAGLIKNILHGKGEKVKGDTLREIKMKRVEGFLKDKLGVLSVPPNKKEADDKFTKLRELSKINNGQKLATSRQDEILKLEVEVNNNFDNQLTSSKVDVDQVSPDVVTYNAVDANNTSITTHSATFIERSPEKMSSERNQPKCESIVDEAFNLTPDILGLYTLMLVVPADHPPFLLEELEEDITWFDSPVSVLCVENGNLVVEVKMKDKEMALAVLKGLREKYPGLEADTNGNHADLYPDKVSGLYTLCFTDSKKKRFKATYDNFQKYSKQPPVISKGLGKEQVLVGFKDKHAAVEAFRDNLDSVEFPQLHVAPSSRNKNDLMK